MTPYEWTNHRVRLAGTASRYLAAEARGASDRHLAFLLGVFAAQVQAALAAGMTPAEVGGAARIVDPPALLGLDDVPADVIAELEHRQTRWVA